MFAIRCKKHGIFPMDKRRDDGCRNVIMCEKCKKEYEKAGLNYPEKYMYGGKLRRNRNGAIKNWNENNK